MYSYFAVIIIDFLCVSYRALQENYRTLINNLEITKKVAMEEMNKGKEISMNKDKLIYDIANATKLCKLVILCSLLSYLLQVLLTFLSSFILLIKTYFPLVSKILLLYTVLIYRLSE